MSLLEVLFKRKPFKVDFGRFLVFHFAGGEFLVGRKGERREIVVKSQVHGAAGIDYINLLGGITVIS